MGWFSRNTEPESLPPNTEFSVVSGQLVLGSGQVVAFTTIVPTVFDSAWDPSRANMTNGAARFETVDFATSMAAITYPASRWANIDAVDLRPATPDEAAWAIANGVNQRFGLP